MAKLYPPIIEKTLPAFYGNSITVPYTLNRAVSLQGDVSGFKIIIKSTITNEVIITKDVETISFEKITFPLDDISELFAGGFYKVQIAFIDKNDKVGYYSPVSIVKYVGKNPPGLIIEDQTLEDDVFIGRYSPSGFIDKTIENKDGTITIEKIPNPDGDITEKMYSYCFTLYDNNGEIIETTGEKLHNSTEDIGLEQRETFSPKIALDSGSNYNLTYTITTINNLKLTQSINITAKKDDSGYKPRNIKLLATMDEENGYMNLKIYSEDSANTRQLIYGKFVIFKTSSKDNFKEKYKIAYFSLENQDIFEKSFKDFTVEAGYSYRYILQQVNDYGIYSEEIYSDGEPVKANYEHLFLFDGIRQLKIKYNPKVSSFKNTILESKIDTIGSQYPFIFRNNNVQYKELSLNGLISYKMDEQNLFLNDSDIWPDVEEGISAKDKWTHNLTYDNITAERAFKLKVLEWLNNGEVKLFKSPTEGNYIVRLLNVSLTPTDTVGRMLHSFSATGYEVDDVNDYQFCQALTIDKTNRYIGYRTTPLYDFPNIKIYNQGLNINNSEYEIIGSPNLEFVVGVRFEDIKPRTKFSVTLERNGETTIHNFMIGATGFYVIPSELGFHIKQIRLVADSWEIEDYGFDIMNNRGQVTYEFERQAKHNNFNDITKIESNTVISEPLYSQQMTVNIEEPLTNIDGISIYNYVSVANEEALIEIAYFKNGNDTPYVRGVDYKVEDGKYYTLTGNELEIDDTKGYLFNIGESVPVFKMSENPNNKEYEYQFITNKIDNIYFKNRNNQIIEKENSRPLNGAILFLPKYNSKGIQEFDYIVADKPKYVNPYYSYCGTTTQEENDKKTITPNIFADIYKLQPLISTGGGKSTVGEQTIYKNFVPNKYYNVTNVDGEYYIKEEIQNLYKLDFELIQVFYEEETPEENAIIDGTVFYEDIDENAGYSRTIRRLSGVKETIIEEGVVKDKQLLSQEELYYDIVTLEQPNIKLPISTIKEKSFITISEFFVIYEDVKNLYKGLPDEKPATEIDLLTNYWNKLTLYKQEKIESGIYGYTIFKGQSIDLSQTYYVNLRLQAYQNYIDRTSPNYNEVIIVFTDNPNHIVNIDLTERLSYSIDASQLDQEDLQNISAIYVGKNVRGFATYKRKLYSYKAILDNGLSVTLEPGKEIIKKKGE